MIDRANNPMIDRAPLPEWAQYQVITSTADGRVFESEVRASSAVEAVRTVAAGIDAVVTHLHARHLHH